MTPKRPRDPNQLAKSIIDIATGQKPDRDPTPEEQGKDPAAVALGKKGGRPLYRERLCSVLDSAGVVGSPFNSVVRKCPEASLCLLSEARSSVRPGM